MKLLSKISTASVFGKVKNAFVFEMDETTGKNKETPKHEIVGVMRVYGTATNYKTVSTDLGDSIRFTGSFEAVNRETGEVFKSSSCFLPETAAGLIAGALEGNQAVSFGFDIDAKFRADLLVGYEYVVTPLVDSSDSDPIAALGRTLAPLKLNGPAPAPSEVKEVEEAPTKKK